MVQIDYCIEMNGDDKEEWGPSEDDHVIYFSHKFVEEVTQREVAMDGLKIWNQLIRGELMIRCPIKDEIYSRGTEFMIFKDLVGYMMF